MGFDDMRRLWNTEIRWPDEMKILWNTEIRESDNRLTQKYRDMLKQENDEIQK